MATHTILRTMHDVGLAAWFGGSLMGAVGVNPAAAAPQSTADRGAVANTAWNRWTPVNLAAIGTHLVGATGLLVTDRHRVAQQKGVLGMSLVKTLNLAAALGVTAYSRALGRKMAQAGPAVPAASGTTPTAQTPPDVAAAQQQLKALQWAVPALTGAMVVESALAGEQQRPSAVSEGVVERNAKRVKRLAQAVV